MTLLLTLDDGSVQRKLADAVEFARAAVLEEAPAEQLGTHVGVTREDAVTASHLFEAQVPGYRGWRWSVTVALAADEDPVTVSEVVLVPGPEALIAPPWVPWERRVRAGDLGVGDIFPTDENDPRLAPAYLQSDDPAVEEVSREAGLGRVHVLSRFGRTEAAARWHSGEFGPRSDMARSAPDVCGTCGFFVQLAGSLSGVFGVCSNDIAPADGHVVDVEYGCGAHSEVEVEVTSSVPVAELVYDDSLLDFTPVEKAEEPDAAAVAESAVAEPEAEVVAPEAEVVAAEAAAAEAAEAKPETAAESAEPEAAAAEAEPDAAVAKPESAEPVAKPETAAAVETATEPEAAAAEAAVTAAEPETAVAAPEAVAATTEPEAAAAEVELESEPEAATAEAAAPDQAEAAIAEPETAAEPEVVAGADSAEPETAAAVETAAAEPETAVAEADVSPAEVEPEVAAVAEQTAAPEVSAAEPVAVEPAQSDTAVAQGEQTVAEGAVSAEPVERDVPEPAEAEPTQAEVTDVVAVEEQPTDGAQAAESVEVTGAGTSAGEDDVPEASAEAERRDDGGR
ncbi:DUF3027 domain-containing protein [Amycolatopsis eburnea]|uniref:DUF3027 domain-containing protein n=1 Tax=Amycolatopsis eburnea TaxID=2267691 RepID=A0A427TA30_9PSEU|nr:DUF3027 domain-containing protein [Amycolatopsis eburnea]RSD19265.1 DUF3027 domain-containing protein [Amycolatopsis eburnea]